MFRKKKITDSIIIEGLKTGKKDWNSITYKHFYEGLKGFYKKKWSKRKNDKMLFKAAYNETIFALMKNVREGKYQPKASLKTYVTEIFKKKLIDEQRKLNTKIHSADEDISTFFDIDGPLNIEKEFQTKEALKEVIKILKNIGENCYEIIMKHAEGFKDKEVAVLLGFANPKVVKSRRFTCKKKLFAEMALKSIDYGI